MVDNMRSCIEIALKPGLVDAEARSLIKKARDYFDVQIAAGRCIHLVTMEADLSPDDLAMVKDEIFTNPVTQVSSLSPLNVPFDWCIWVGFRPGVRDNAGSTAIEAISDFLKRDFLPGEGIYTSRRYCLSGPDLEKKDVEKIADELLANGIIQQWKVFSRADWDAATGVGTIIPKVLLNHEPQCAVMNIASNEALQNISNERNLALNPRDIPVIREYFLDPNVLGLPEKSRACPANGFGA